LIFVLIISLFTTGNVFAVERICVENRICVFPGDFLTYSGSQVGEFSYIFEEFVDDHRIQYVHSSFNAGDPFEETYILDLQNGDTFEINSPKEKYNSFVMLSTIPVEIDQLSTDVSEETYQFKNMKRQVWTVNPKVEGGSSKIVLDKETGIVLELNIKIKSEFEGQSVDIELVNKLLDTNIIDELTTIEFEKLIPVKESVPDWIRNTALWWSEELISDDEFVNAIQFLIDEGIIQVSMDLTSNVQTSPIVPNWIKDTAGWWATKKVSDADFLNGIKWLIENGIIRV